LSPFLREDLRRLARAERRGRAVDLLALLAWPLLGLAGLFCAVALAMAIGGAR
jgi:hypothetical protein